MTLFSWSRSASAAALSFLAIAACSSDPLYPVQGKVDAVYAVKSVAGQPLPFKETGVDSYLLLIADTLKFYSTGSVTRITVWEATDGSSNPTPIHNKATGNYAYTIDGTRLTLTYSCPPNADCIGPLKGDISASRVLLPYGIFGDRYGDMVFNRVE